MCLACKAEYVLTTEGQCVQPVDIEDITDCGSQQYYNPHDGVSAKHFIKLLIYFVMLVISILSCDEYLFITCLVINDQIPDCMIIFWLDRVLTAHDNDWLCTVS